jgi:hypothetical protein
VTEVGRRPLSPAFEEARTEEVITLAGAERADASAHAGAMSDMQHPEISQKATLPSGEAYRVRSSQPPFMGMPAAA